MWYVLQTFCRFLRAVIDHGDPIFTFPCITYGSEKREETLTVVEKGMVECIRNDRNPGLIMNGKAVTEAIQSFIIFDYEPLLYSRIKQVILFQKTFDGCLFVTVHTPDMDLNFC